MTNIARTSVESLAEDLSWLGSAHGFEATETGTADVSTFTEADHYPNGYLLSGLAIEKSGTKWVPYVGGTTRGQTITRTATGGTVDITVDGEADGGTGKTIVAATTAAQVKTAIVALPNVTAADIAVTGSAGGPYLVTGNIGTIAIDATNATGGTVTVAETTAQVADAATDYAHLATSTKVNPADTTVDVGIALFTHGKVREANLPAHHGVDAAFKAAVRGSIRYI